MELKRNHQLLMEHSNNNLNEGPCITYESFIIILMTNTIKVFFVPKTLSCFKTSSGSRQSMFETLKLETEGPGKCMFHVIVDKRPSINSITPFYRPFNVYE